MNPVVNPMPMPFDPREAVVISIKTKANDTLVIKTDSILGILYIPQEDYLKLYISDSPMPGAVRDMESGLPLITLRGVERAEAERVMDLYTKWHSRFIMGVLSPYPVRVADAEEVKPKRRRRSRGKSEPKAASPGDLQEPRGPEPPAAGASLEEPPANAQPEPESSGGAL